jgi:hypothetical protein
VIVYRDQRRRADPRELLLRLTRQVDRLPRRPAHDTIVGLLIDLGALEAGVADALAPSEDDEGVTNRAFRLVALAAGYLLIASWEQREDDSSRWRTALEQRLHDCVDVPLPTVMDLRVPEGFAHYGLFPECYIVAARRAARELRPASAVCLGLRSIGTALSAVVAAALEDEGCPVSSYTLRPRGHPFDRRPAVSPGLRHRLASSAESHFLLVDEGPGISGSSLAGTAEALSELGVPDDHIVLLPSWDPDPSALRAEVARSRWPRHRRYLASFEEVWLDTGRLAGITGHGALRDISAGRWREELIPDHSRRPAVHPQHERRKLRGAGTLVRFVGLGSAGAGKLPRAQQLADASFSPKPCGLSHGFLVREFAPGAPLVEGEMDAALLERMAGYLAHLRLAFTLPGQERTPLHEMMVTNLAGHPLARRIESLEAGDEPPVAVDGRMMPHEWLRTQTGYLKVDALDHHDDHFFPGPTDIAWDLAGAAVEFGMDRAARAALVERYLRISRDRTIARRLPFYTAAYLACRIGYVSLAMETLGDSREVGGFDGLRQRYLGLLTQELSVPPGTAWPA